MADTNAHINYTVTDIDRYLNGQMTAKEMHELERAALQDPFLSDAIEGYREADRTLADKHLKEITAAIQGAKPEAKVVKMPAKKTYWWQIAASVIVLITAGVLFFYKQPQNKSPLVIADNQTKITNPKDTNIQNKMTESAPVTTDSLLAFAKPGKPVKIEQKKASKGKKTNEPEYARAADVSALQLKAGSDTNTVTNWEASKSIANSRQQIPMATSPNDSISLADVVASGYATQSAKKSKTYTWTNAKGKPFVLSEVEQINLGRKQTILTDTSSVKPEGGWQSFQDYLFTKMHRKDTATFGNFTSTNGNLELEFSLTETGLPYNIQVIHAQDSTAAKNAVTALQEGPKWISKDKKEKRLNLKY